MFLIKIQLISNKILTDKDLEQTQIKRLFRFDYSGDHGLGIIMEAIECTLC